MNKSELIQALSDKSGIAPDRARYFVETMIDLMKKQLEEGGRIEIRGFGSFEIREYGAYKGRNPHTGESVDVKAKRTPFFKCGKELRDLLNEGNA
jgi:integration host factor subunit beta